MIGRGVEDLIGETPLVAPRPGDALVEATAGNGLALVAGARGYGLAAPRIAREGRLDGPVLAVLPDDWGRYRSRIFDGARMARVP